MHVCSGTDYTFAVFFLERFCIIIIISYSYSDSPNSSTMLTADSNVSVHMLSASKSGTEKNKPLTPTHNKREKHNVIAHLKSGALLRVSRLGKAAIKGVYVHVLRPALAFAVYVRLHILGIWLSFICLLFTDIFFSLPC